MVLLSLVPTTSTAIARPFSMPLGTAMNGALTVLNASDPKAIAASYLPIADALADQSQYLPSPPVKQHQMATFRDTLRHSLNPLFSDALMGIAHAKEPHVAAARERIDFLRMPDLVAAGLVTASAAIQATPAVRKGLQV